MPIRRLSFRIQLILVFFLCLTMMGVGMIFFNTWLISREKNQILAEAKVLAQEQGHLAVDKIKELMKEEGLSNFADLQNTPDIRNRFRVIAKEISPSVISLSIQDAKGTFNFNLNVDESDPSGSINHLHSNVPKKSSGIPMGVMPIIKIGINDIEPVSVSADISMEEKVLGHLNLVMSRSSAYQQIQKSSKKINHMLGSMLLAFIGILTLALLIVAKISRRQIHLLAENEKLGRMAYVGTLASGLAHEIRNPLNAMSINLAAAETELDTNDEKSPELIARAHELIQNEIQRLNRSVTGFMAFARPDSTHIRETDLRPLVEEIIELLHPQIKKSQTSVELDLPSETLLQADFSGLRQVLYNVMLNAIQAMADMPNLEDGSPPQRILRIGGRRESAQWRLFVEDTGPGIPVGEEMKVFEAFYTTKAAGSGFGLSIASAVVASHGGTIDVRRRPEGGTRFEITLPETSPGKNRIPSR